MLSNSLKRILKRSSLHKITHKTFGESTHNLKPGDKAPTLATATIPINVETFEGQFHRIIAQIGKSLWEEMAKNGIKIGGSCGGGVQDHMREKPIQRYVHGNHCRLCYCAIDQPWFGKMEIHPYETRDLAAILETFPANARFSCNIEVEGWMEEMIVRVPTRKGWKNMLSDTSEPSA